MKRPRAATTEESKKKKAKKATVAYPLSEITPLEGNAHIFRLENETVMPDAARLYLAEHGYVVIENVISSVFRRMICRMLGKEMAAMETGIDPELKIMPSNKMFPSLFSKGIIKDPAAGLHAGKSAWEVRRKVCVVFEALYQTNTMDGLVTSVDGLTCFRGPNKKYLTDTPWWHVDSNGPACVQGLALMTNTTASTGGFVVLPGSHRPAPFRITLDSLKSTRANFLPIQWDSPVMRQQFVDCGGAKLVTAPKGSVTLWDSRLIHSNTCRLRPPASVEEHQENGHGAFSRLGYYVCMLPRQQAWAEHRRKIIEQASLTNHWPDLNMRKQHLIYPRPATSLPLTSVALEYGTKDFIARYGHML